MPIISETTNYTGRTTDVSIFQYPNAKKVDKQVVEPKFGNPSRLCAGVQKLIQRYTVLLLTNLGSQEDYPDFGVEFINTLYSGVDPLDVIGIKQLFSLANYNVLLVLKEFQSNNPDQPLDEQIESAQLIRFNSLGDNVSFDVKITTLAGENVDFLVPLPK